ncbi:hypothetical protein HNV12_01055 [Methanococcoides sp. SA1]|nr:hypothetical protein [Methanococcoides sp. SA1]
MKKEGITFLIILFALSLAQVSAIEPCTARVAEENLEIIAITDEEASWSWTTGEERNIQVEITNGNYSERDFEIELLFYDQDNVLETNFTQETLIETVTLNESETTIANFSATPNDMPAGEYFLYAKLTDSNNDSICTSLQAETESQKINITLGEEEHLAIIKTITGPTTVTVGSTAEYTVEIKNIGSAEEERVLAIIYNAAFQIREEKEIFGLGIEESENITFNFTLPSSATPQNDTILFSVEFNYDSTSGIYQNEALKDKVIPIQIISSTQIPISTQNETTPQTQTEQNQTISQETTTPTTTETEAESTFKLPDLPYLLITSIILLITAIAAALFFYFKRKKSPPTTQTITPSMTPSTPAGTNTANTASPQPVQTPPQTTPNSPQVQPITPSSPTQTPAAPTSPPQASPNQPQTNQPSPQPPVQDKTSSP